MAEHLSTELDRLVQQELATGEYDSREELLLAGVRLLSAFRDHHHNQLRQQIKEGFDQLDRGEGIELDDVGLRRFFDDIQDRGQQLALGALFGEG